MAAPSLSQFDTLSLHAGPAARPAPRAPAPRPSTQPPPSCSATPTMPRRCSTWSARGMSTRASPIQPTRCSKSASPHSKAASERSPPPAARPRCTLRRDARRGRLPHRLLPLAVRRLAQSSAVHPKALRHRNHLRRPARSRRLAQRDPARTRGCCSPRRWAIPGSTCSTSRRSRDRARRRAAAAARLDLHHPLPDAALRARRRPALPLGDQVPRRSRHRHRRLAGGRRQLRLGSLGKISRADRALRGIPRDGLPGGVHRRRFPAARAARGPARFRRVHEPDHRLPDPSGRRDTPRAHGAARREHAQGRRVPGRSRGGRVGRPSRSCPRTPTTSWRRHCCRAEQAPCSPSASRADALPAARSSRRCGFSRTSPTSETPSRW